MSDERGVEPPEAIQYDLDEALTLLAALEDARDALIDSGHLAVVVAVETEIRVLSRNPGSTIRRKASMAADLLRASEAARRLAMPTRDLDLNGRFVDLFDYVADMADEAAGEGIHRHVHNDPTTDPEGQYFEPDSLALVISEARD